MKFFTDLHDLLLTSTHAPPPSQFPIFRFPTKRYLLPSPPSTKAPRRSAYREKRRKSWHKTGYFLFREHKRNEFRLDPDHKHLKLIEMTSLIAKEWNLMPQTEQELWRLKAKQMRADQLQAEFEELCKKELASNGKTGAMDLEEAATEEAPSIDELASEVHSLEEAPSIGEASTIEEAESPGEVYWLLCDS